MHPCPMAELGPQATDRPWHREGQSRRALVRPHQQHPARTPARKSINNQAIPDRPTSVAPDINGARAPLPFYVECGNGSQALRIQRACTYAARTLARKLSTALRSAPDWLSSSRALVSTSVAAAPVASAAEVTPPILALISLEPAATDWMLRAISRVASPCCSIDAEMPAVISLISAMVWVIPPIAATASLVEVCIAVTWAEISSVALAVWLASALTSEATTAKPRPDSPARAASMVALSASRLVCAAMLWISFTTSPIFSAPVESACTVELVRSASCTALLAISLERETWR